MRNLLRIYGHLYIKLTLLSRESLPFFLQLNYTYIDINSLHTLTYILNFLCYLSSKLKSINTRS